MQVIKHGGQFNIRLVNDSEHRGLHDNFAARSPYDVIIRAIGFHFDDSIFDKSIIPKLGEGEKKKYPAIKPNYESVNVESLFFAGTNTHSLDFRKSAGGFIHGFRYTTRALHRLLECRNHKHPWPSTTLRTTQVMNTLLKRTNEASGLYQMYNVLGDVIIVNDTDAVYLEEVPVQLLPQLETATGHLAPNKVIVMAMEFGKNFSDFAGGVMAGAFPKGLPKCQSTDKNIFWPPFSKRKRRGGRGGGRDGRRGGGGRGGGWGPSFTFYF
ncbi:FOXRED2 [Branchiostoma lanceolatum]|uniref:FOXRED2 protein n=1 Tax=Branchiostoma lanceolatum TaxID=7740 RepID=A0A8K0EF03_BRALA|nr:FOXRED2 [Branchiostoma lanceolatum]